MNNKEVYACIGLIHAIGLVPLADFLPSEECAIFQLNHNRSISKYVKADHKAWVKHQGSVAQWITRLTTDQKIPGSTPGRLVTFEPQILSHLYSNATAHHQLQRFYPVAPYTQKTGSFDMTVCLTWSL